MVCENELAALKSCIESVTPSHLPVDEAAGSGIIPTWAIIVGALLVILLIAYLLGHTEKLNGGIRNEKNNKNGLNWKKLAIVSMIITGILALYCFIWDNDDCLVASIPSHDFHYDFSTYTFDEREVKIDFLIRVSNDFYEVNGIESDERINFQHYSLSIIKQTLIPMISNTGSEKFYSHQHDWENDIKLRLQQSVSFGSGIYDVSLTLTGDEYMEKKRKDELDLEMQQLSLIRKARELEIEKQADVLEDAYAKLRFDNEISALNFELEKAKAKSKLDVFNAEITAKLSNISASYEPVEIQLKNDLDCGQFDSHHDSESLYNRYGSRFGDGFRGRSYAYICGDWNWSKARCACAIEEYLKSV